MTRRLPACAGGLIVWSLCQSALAVDVAARVNAAQPVGQKVEFAANAVGEGEIAFTWDFGDGSKRKVSGSGTVTHVYDEPGHYPVIVVAKDDVGARSDSFLQTIHRKLPPRPPTSSATIIFDETRGRVCNVNADNDSVSCLSTETFALEFEAEVGRHPRTLAVSADGTIWVTNQDDATVSVLDGDDGELLHTVVLPRASKPFGIALNRRLGVAYVSLQALGQIAEIDLSNGSLLRTVDVGPWATGVAVDSSGERLWVTRFISPDEHGEVVEVDAEELTVVQTLELAFDPGPDTEASARGVPNYLRSVVVSPDDAFAWVPSKKDNIARGHARDGETPTFETSVRTIVSLVDLAKGREVLESRLDLNNRSLGLSLTFSPQGDYAFVGLMGNNAVEVIDAYSGRIVAGAFELGQAPDGVVLDDAGHLYVNSFLSRAVLVLDASGILASTDFAMDLLAEVSVSKNEKLDPEVLFGKQVFYDAADPRMSRDGYISCASCHLDGFEDGRVWDFTDRGEGLRNTTSLLSKRGAGQGRLHWSANFDEIQDFEHDIRGPFGGTGFIADDEFLQGTRNTTLEDPKAGLSPELDALDAYLVTLDTANASPFRDEDGSLTEAGWRGLAVFERLDCQSCHSGADYTDSSNGEVHDVGTLTDDSGQRLGKRLRGLDTPTLRGVWETAPYLHDGSAATLEEVLVERNGEALHGATSELSGEEIDDLVQYLRQIDNTPREEEVEPVAPEAPVVDREKGADEPSSKGGCSLAPSKEGSFPLFLVWVASFLCLARVRGERRRSLGP